MKKDDYRKIYKRVGETAEERIRLIKQAFKVIINNILPTDRKAYLSLSKLERKATLEEVEAVSKLGKVQREEQFRERGWGLVEEL